MADKDVSSHVAQLLDDIARDAVTATEEELRAQLAEHGLVAFIADGSILPRNSGTSDRKDASSSKRGINNARMAVSKATPTSVRRGRSSTKLSNRFTTTDITTSDRAGTPARRYSARSRRSVKALSNLGEYRRDTVSDFP